MAEPHRNVFLFIPNIIGYIRILLLAYSFYHILSDYKLALASYLLSCLLDAFDGLAARMFDQSSRFGAMLDMLTDRVSTMCLLMILGLLYREHFFVIQALLVLDIVSHWLHFFASNLQGRSHKTSNAGWIMKIYYENKFVLTTVCALEQVFYCSLIVLHHEGFNHLSWLIITAVPAVVFKNGINLLQVVRASRVIGELDSSKNN